MGQCAALPSRRGAKNNVRDFDGCQDVCANGQGCSSKPSQLVVHGHSILDDYEVSQEVLGTGISGPVRVVKRRTTGEKFALKILLDIPVARREIQLQHLCQHPHIVRIIDVYENILKENRCLFVIMELMDGGPLFDRIKQRRLTEREAARIMRDIGSAVAHMHSFNVAHRDIKPENMLYTKKGVLKLADFGFAKQIHDGDDRPLRTACYTHYYVPPEILQRVRYDKSCDMWSLGVVMYILLCGFPPFFSEGGTDFSAGMRRRIRTGDYCFPSPEWDCVSKEAKALVTKLLVTDPSSRITIEEMMKDEWIVRCSRAPKTPLFTPSYLSFERMLDIQEAMGKELTGMRIANDEVHIKPLNESNNKILTRRRLMKQNDAKLQNGTAPYAVNGI